MVCLLASAAAVGNNVHPKGRSEEQKRELKGKGVGEEKKWEGNIDQRRPIKNGDVISKEAKAFI